METSVLQKPHPIGSKKRLRRTKEQIAQGVLLTQLQHGLLSEDAQDCVGASKKESEGGYEGNKEIEALTQDKTISRWINIQKYSTTKQGIASTKYFSYNVGGDLWDSKEEAIKNKSQFTWDTVEVIYKNPEYSKVV